MLGTRIGNYEVISQIGEGGMGAVYRARHAVLARDAAVKVLLPALSHDRGNLTRFFNEARAATAIRHPGIVEVHDYGSLHDGSAYIVMELLDGESLGARIRRTGARPAAPWLPLVRQIAGALHAAHEQGIVHRDLKPDNVFLIRDPEIEGGERIKLLDFGIAKLAHTPGDASKTRTGAVMGTPTYMSPEQCRDAGLVDRRADLYALGCILYELACGRPPFLTDGVGDLIAHHLYFEPQPPRALQPTIPEPVEQLIMWLLRKQPEARPATALEVIRAIDHIVVGLGGRATTSDPGMTFGTAPAHAAVAVPQLTTLSGAAGTRPASAPRRRSRWVVIGTVAALAIGIGSWIVLGRGDPPRPRPAPRAATDVRAAPPPSAAPAAIVDAAPPSPAPERAVTTAPTAPPAATEVTLTIDSDPAGVEVLDGTTVIGRTPLTFTRPRADGARAFTLRRHGYDPATIELSTAEDDRARVLLRKRATSSRSSSPSPRAPAPARPAPRGRNTVGNGGVQPFD